jgi:hypothetical protein
MYPAGDRSWGPGIRLRGNGGSRNQRLGEVQFDFIDIAPTPGFAGLERAHEGVFRAMEVFGGVFVFGGIAAADVSAFKAKAKMNPGVAHSQTFFATIGVRGDFVDMRKMRAGRHDDSPL